MKKVIGALVFLLVLSSCDTNECAPSVDSASCEGTQENPIPPPVPSPEVPVDPQPENPKEDPEEGTSPEGGNSLPNEAFTFDIEAKLFNFSASSEEKVLRAFDIIKKVIRTEEFRERVLGFKYNSENKFMNNKNLTNFEIYEILLEGAEELLPQKNNKMDLELQLYTNNFTSTVGYTYKNELRIYMNTKYFNSYTPAEVAGNIFHEWTHKLGFEHDSKNTPGRSSSVPYALGYIMEDLGRFVE